MPSHPSLANLHEYRLGNVSQHGAPVLPNFFHTKNYNIYRTVWVEHTRFRGKGYPPKDSAYPRTKAGAQKDLGICVLTPVVAYLCNRRCKTTVDQHFSDTNVHTITLGSC